jgi:predicted deacylase
LKNNQAVLFGIGLFIGGTIMLLLLGFQNLAAFSGAPSTPTQPSQDFPRLLALESTSLPPQRTSTVVPTSTLQAKIISTSASVTSTPLVLLHNHQPDVIGRSVEGRPLNVYAFGTGEHQRMIVADIHGGDEWNTLTLANQLISYIDQHPETIPADVTLYVLPALNPDGEARAHNKYGRLNHNDVDLNRNFPVNWRLDWDRAGCWNYLPSTGGTGPGSEAETQAFMKFIEAHKIEALISYHSAALGIFPGGAPWDEKSVQLAQAVAAVTSYPFPPLDTGCAYSGTLADYAVANGIAAIEVELTNHFDSDFDQNLNVLNVLLNFVP